MGLGLFTQTFDELEALGFATGKALERLAEAQVAEPDFLEEAQRVGEGALFEGIQKAHGFCDAEVEDLVDRETADTNGAEVFLVTTSFAFRAANKEIAEELHFDFFKAAAAAPLAAPISAVERKGARCHAGGLGFGGARKEVANAVKDAEVEGGAGARGA